MAFAPQPSNTYYEPSRALVVIVFGLFVALAVAATYGIDRLVQLGMRRSTER